MCVKLCIHTYVCVRDWANRFTDHVIITTYCVPHNNSRENNEKTNPAHTILTVYVRKISAMNDSQDIPAPPLHHCNEPSFIRPEQILASPPHSENRNQPPAHRALYERALQPATARMHILFYNSLSLQSSKSSLIRVSARARNK